ncbi:MAG: class I SAM-dependent methyltransferase [Spirochaetales bacterium]|nr:class I SAM-dependent methyltransferase [Spirochaetales bacterium]
MYHTPDPAHLAERTQDIYERNARRFDAERSRVLFERPWLDRFASLLPGRATVLDVGCGAGVPIARYLIDIGLQVTGIDASREMIAMSAERFPTATWLIADMRDLALERKFNGIVSWHAFFHLTPAEQRRTLPLLARHLTEEGALLLTVGPAEGEIVGSVGGEAVYHGSLSPSEYRQRLAELGLEIVDFVPEDPNCDNATVLLAQKRIAV